MLQFFSSLKWRVRSSVYPPHITDRTTAVEWVPLALLVKCPIRAAAPKAKSLSSFSFMNHIDQVKPVMLNRLSTKDTNFTR